MLRISKRTRRGLAESIFIPGTLGSVVGILLILAQWLEAGS